MYVIFTAFERYFEPNVLPEIDASYRPTHGLFCTPRQLSQTKTNQTNTIQINNPDIQQYITNRLLNLPNLPRPTSQGMQIVPYLPRRPIKLYQTEPFQPWQLTY